MRRDKAMIRFLTGTGTDSAEIDLGGGVTYKGGRIMINGNEHNITYSYIRSSGTLLSFVRKLVKEHHLSEYKLAVISGYRLEKVHGFLRGYKGKLGIMDGFVLMLLALFGYELELRIKKVGEPDYDLIGKLQEDWYRLKKIKEAKRDGEEED